MTRRTAVPAGASSQYERPGEFWYLPPGHSAHPVAVLVPVPVPVVLLVVPVPVVPVPSPPLTSAIDTVSPKLK